MRVTLAVGQPVPGGRTHRVRAFLEVFVELHVGEGLRGDLEVRQDLGRPVWSCCRPWREEVHEIGRVLAGMVPPAGICGFARVAAGELDHLVTEQALVRDVGHGVVADAPRFAVHDVDGRRDGCRWRVAMSDLATLPMSIPPRRTGAPPFKPCTSLKMVLKLSFGSNSRRSSPIKITTPAMKRPARTNAPTFASRRVTIWGLSKAYPRRFRSAAPASETRG